MLDSTGPGGTATLESFLFALGLVNSVAPIPIFLALYVSSSYGFVVMVWKESMPRGILMLALAVVQIVANTRTHPRG